MLYLRIIWQPGGFRHQLNMAMVITASLSILSARVCVGQPAPQAEEHRSVIQEVEGIAYLGEDHTMADLRQLALTNAKQLALEGAQTAIQAKTVVKNGQLDYDLVVMGAEGNVRILDQKDLGLRNNSRYHVWIKAEVSYVLKSAVSTLQPDSYTGADAPLTVSIWTAAQEHRSGERVVIFMQANRDFYARIINQTSRDEIIQLLPNAYRPDHFFRAKQLYRIPGEKDRFAIQVTPPYGTERVVVYASETPLGAIEMETLPGGLKQYRGSLPSLAETSRALAVVPTNQSTEFFESTWAFTTRP